jgi:hypothetical protein
MGLLNFKTPPLGPGTRRGVTGAVDPLSTLAREEGHLKLVNVFVVIGYTYRKLIP